MCISMIRVRWGVLYTANATPNGLGILIIFIDTGDRSQKVTQSLLLLYKARLHNHHWFTLSHASNWGIHLKNNHIYAYEVFLRFKLLP